MHSCCRALSAFGELSGPSPFSDTTSWPIDTNAAPKRSNPWEGHVVPGSGVTNLAQMHLALSTPGREERSEMALSRHAFFRVQHWRTRQLTRRNSYVTDPYSPAVGTHTNLRRWNTHKTTMGTDEQTHKPSDTHETQSRPHASRHHREPPPRKHPARSCHPTLYQPSARC